MKLIMIVGVLFTLVFITSSLSAGNPDKAGTSDGKKVTPVIETTDDTGVKYHEKEMQKKIGTTERGKNGKNTHNEPGDRPAAGHDGGSKLKKETVVGYVVSIDNLTGEIVVQDENKKTKRTIRVNRATLETMNAGDKVNVELAPGTDTAERVNIIAVGKGGSKSKSGGKRK